MKEIPKTALERAVLERFHLLYGDKGFPGANSIRVLGRNNTGGGRYVHLECEAPVALADGYVDLGGSYLESSAVPDGLMAVVLVKGGRITMLEITVYGGGHWNGEEDEWRIV